MNDNMKLMVAASCGAAVGAVTAFAVTFVVTRRSKKKAVESALEAQRERYEEYISKKCGKQVETDQNNEEPEEIQEEQISEQASDSVMRKANVHKTDYSKSANIIEEFKYGPGLDETQEYRAGPYVISEVQYSEERLTYDKVTCNYFEPDGILLDEDAEEYEPMDITRDVGWSNLEYFKKDDELEEIHVRNDNQSTDYFIKRVRHSVEDVE